MTETSSSSHYERAKQLSEKLLRFADLGRRKQRLADEEAELLSDAELCRALGLPVPSGDNRPAEDSTPSPEKPADETAGKATPTGTPLTATGRLPRGYLEKVLPEIARKRFQGAPATIGEIRDVVDEELAYEIHRNTIKTVMRRMVEAGSAEMNDDDTGPTRYRLNDRGGDL